MMSNKKFDVDKIILRRHMVVMTMTPAQCRAARAWLNWSQGMLAHHASVGLSTVKSFENGVTKPIANNLAAMQRALEDAGVEMAFDEGKAIGIRVPVLHVLP